MRSYQVFIFKRLFNSDFFWPFPLMEVIALWLNTKFVKFLVCWWFFVFRSWIKWTNSCLSTWDWFMIRLNIFRIDIFAQIEMWRRLILIWIKNVVLVSIHISLEIRFLLLLLEVKMMDKGLLSLRKLISVLGDLPFNYRRSTFDVEIFSSNYLCLKLRDPGP